MRAKVYKPKHHAFTRHWTYPCPVCGRPVRVNANGTIAAHHDPRVWGPVYCEGSREPV